MVVVSAAVIDEHEIFRRGLAAALSQEPGVVVVVESSSPDGVRDVDVDVAVASIEAWRHGRIELPTIVCTDAPIAAREHDPHLVGVVPRSSLTPEQLIGAVRAAAAGLRVQIPTSTHPAPVLDLRRLHVLRLLSEGASTKEIARTLRYSERTIKAMIRQIEERLGARSRAHAVAVGIKDGLI